MTLHVSSASIQFEIDESSKSLAELVANAGRKRRIFEEALQESVKQRRHCILLGLISGFLAAVVGISSLLDLEATPYFVIGTIVASIISGCAGGVVLLMDYSLLYGRLQSDTARCDQLIRLMKSMRRDDAHATTLGRDMLLTLSKEFKKIADAYDSLDETEFEVFQWSGDGQRFRIKRHDRIRPRNPQVKLILPNGDKRNALIKNFSRSGVALLTDVMVDPGTMVTIGSTLARAVRIMDSGIAFEFLALIPAQRFSKSMRL